MARPNPKKEKEVTSVPDTTITKTVTTNNGISFDLGAPTVNPNAQTQTGRGNNVFSQSQATVAKNETSKAQVQTFTYATNKSGNTFIIPSNLSLEARQYYLSLGVSTSSQPPTEASFEAESETQVIVTQEELANYLNEGVENPKENDAKVIKPDQNKYTDNQKPKGDESTANGVQFGANTNGSDNPIVADADPNWAMGQKLVGGTAGDSLTVLDQATKKDVSSQYLPQINDIVYPRETLESFAQNGANGVTAGMDNIKESIGKIMQNKYFPFIALGFVGLIVLSIMRGGKGGASAPPVQITRYG